MALDLASQAPVVPVVVIGEDKVISVRLTDGATGLPFDVSAATEIDAVLEKADGTCIHKLFTTSGVVKANAVAGFIQIILSASDTALLKVSDAGAYSNIEIRLTIASKLTIVLLKDVIQVVQKLFPNC